MLRRFAIVLWVFAICLARTPNLCRAAEPSIADKPNFTAEENRIRRVLTEPTECNFSEVPLKAVINYFKQKHHIEIKFDMAALKNADPPIDPSETLITKNLKDVTLAEGLHTILSDYGLTYLMIDEQLRITSNHEAEHIMCTDYYDVHDLIPPGEKAGREAAFSQLTGVLTNTVEPYNWEKVEAWRWIGRTFRQWGYLRIGHLPDATYARRD